MNNKLGCSEELITSVHSYYAANAYFLKSGVSTPYKTMNCG